MVNFQIEIEQGLTSHQTHYKSYSGRVFMGQMTFRMEISGLDFNCNNLTCCWQDVFIKAEFVVSIRTCTHMHSTDGYLVAGFNNHSVNKLNLK